MDMIEKIHQQLQTERTEGEPDPFRLSQAGKCARLLAYLLHFSEEVPLPSPKALAIFQLGDRIHDWVREKLQAIYGNAFHSVERRVELVVNRNLAVPGHTDGILDLEDSSLLLDIKSANEKSVARMLEYGVPYDYRAQVNAYLEATGLEKGALLVYNKNTSEMHLLPIGRDPAVVAQVRARFEAVWASTPDKPPEREYPRDSFQCAYCPFRERCWQ